MSDNQARKPTNIVKKILADTENEPTNFPSPSTSPEDLNNSIDALLLDASADIESLDVSDKTDESIHSEWEGSSDERRI